MQIANQRYIYLSILIAVCAAVVGFAGGVVTGIQPLYMGLGIGVAVVLIYFFASFPQAVLMLLIVRSSIDIFSKQQIPSALAIGIDALTLIYVGLLLLQQKKVQTDAFWWFSTLR